MVGLPLMMILPPDDVPAAVLLAAFRVTALDEVLVVEMFCDWVRLPPRVATLIVPEEASPLVDPTAPIASASLSV